MEIALLTFQSRDLRLCIRSQVNEIIVHAFKLNQRTQNNNYVIARNVTQFSAFSALFATLLSFSSED